MQLVNAQETSLGVHVAEIRSESTPYRAKERRGGGWTTERRG